MRHWKIIGAIVLFLAEVALQVSGHTNMLLAVIIAVITVALLIWSAWPIVLRLEFRMPVTLKNGQPFSSEIASNISRLPRRPKYDKERLRQANEWLNETIERGEELSREMQSRGFNWAQLELWVHRWVHGIQKEVSEKMPSYSVYVSAQQGGLTEEEKLLYTGWGNREATLRVMVDRYLAKLRAMRSQL